MENPFVRTSPDVCKKEDSKWVWDTWWKRLKSCDLKAFSSEYQSWGWRVCISQHSTSHSFGPWLALVENHCVWAIDLEPRSLNVKLSRLFCTVGVAKWLWFRPSFAGSLFCGHHDCCKKRACPDSRSGKRGIESICGYIDMTLVLWDCQSSWCSVLLFTECYFDDGKNHHVFKPQPFLGC